MSWRPTLARPFLCTWRERIWPNWAFPTIQLFWPPWNCRPLPDVKVARVVRRRSGPGIRAVGFRQISQRGSHAKLRRVLPNGTRENLTVPLHDELDRGTLQVIYRQASRYISEPDLRLHLYTD